MKKIYILLLAAATGAASCQPYFEMVPPGGPAPVEQEFSENWFVTKDGSGVKNGSDWNNAIPFSELLTMISNPNSSLSEAGIHIQEGEYLVTEKDKFLSVTKDIRCIRGGYKKGLMYDDLSECDPEAYPTIFTGDVDGNGKAAEGDGAFMYITEGTVRLENIHFRHFWYGTEAESETSGKGTALFGINGSYLTTSLECSNCVFEDCVNGVSGTASHEGGPVAFITQGYFKARGCVFKDNSGNSRGGALRTIGTQAVIFLDRCLFTGNTLTGGSFGSAIQCSDGVICANNCTMIGNKGSGSTLNGGGAFFLSNNTIIDGEAASGTNNAAFRCESKVDRESSIINNVFSSSIAEGCGIIINASGTFLSKGFNVVKNVVLGSGCSNALVKEDLTKDIVLDGKLNDNCWEWDIAQIEEDLKGYTNADEVYDAAVAFDPSAYCKISVLGRAYATWVTPNAFSYDGRGEMRGDDAFQPGSYDPNLDE